MEMVDAVYPSGSDDTAASRREAAYASLVDFIEISCEVDQSQMGAAITRKLPPAAATRWQEYVGKGYAKLMSGSNGGWKLFRTPAFRMEVLSRFIKRPLVLGYEAKRNQDSSVQGASDERVNLTYFGIELGRAIDFADTTQPMQLPKADCPSWSTCDAQLTVRGGRVAEISVFTRPGADLRSVSQRVTERFKVRPTDTGRVSVCSVYVGAVGVGNNDSQPILEWSSNGVNAYLEAHAPYLDCRVGKLTIRLAADDEQRADYERRTGAF